MFRNLSQRAGRNVFSATKRQMGGHSPLNGEATSPHYADFGYGANQMLPFHELQKNPIPYKWTPRPTLPRIISGHHPELHQHQLFTQATGHSISIVAGFDHVGEANAKKAVADRIRGGLGYFAVLSTLVGYEIFMWGGLQFPQQPIWDELEDINTRCFAHSLQWEKSWREIQREATPAELYKIIRNRPFNTNNPYRFSETDFDIANKNISNRALEPVLQAVDADLYRKQTNYIIFYSALAAQMHRVENAKDLETELSEWLLNQTKFSAAELQEIMAFAPQWNAEFSFHKHAVFDKTTNQVIFFEGAHRATVEEAQKEAVPSLKDSGASAAAAQPLLAQLIKAGPQGEFNAALAVQDKDQTAQRQAVIAFVAMEPADVSKFDRLQKLAEQVLSSSDNSLETYQANAKGLNLPVPAAFTTSAINYAISKAV